MAVVQDRRYEPSDRTACMSIFNSNLPTFFAEEERQEFEQFLEDVPSNNSRYLVLTYQEKIVACGGLKYDEIEPVAHFSWGMVDRAFHRQGFGTYLLLARLKAAKTSTQVDRLRLATSQHTRPFYEKHGFHVTDFIRDGFGSGLHRYDMTLELA